MKKSILSLLLTVISYLAFGQGNPGLVAIADTYIYSGDKPANFGKDSKLRVLRTKGSTVIRHSFLKFDISSVNSSNLNKASLKLYCNSIDDASAGLSLDISETPADWTEKTVNWSDAPKPIKKISSLSVNAQGNYIEGDLTEYIKAALAAGTKQISLRISDAKSTGNKTEFGSKESKNPPLLMIQ